MATGLNSPNREHDTSEDGKFWGIKRVMSSTQVKLHQQQHLCYRSKTQINSSLTIISSLPKQSPVQSFISQNAFQPCHHCPLCPQWPDKRSAKPWRDNSSWLRLDHEEDYDKQRSHLHQEYWIQLLHWLQHLLHCQDRQGSNHNLQDHHIDNHQGRQDYHCQAHHFLHHHCDNHQGHANCLDWLLRKGEDHYDHRKGALQDDYLQGQCRDYHQVVCRSSDKDREHQEHHHQQGDQAHRHREGEQDHQVRHLKGLDQNSLHHLRRRTQGILHGVRPAFNYFPMSLQKRWLSRARVERGSEAMRWRLKTCTWLWLLLLFIRIAHLRDSRHSFDECF